MDNLGLKLSDCLNDFKKNKFILLGILAGFILLMVILLAFVYNPSKKVYIETFKIGTKDIYTGIYPDGSKFNYLDIINDDRLNSIIEEDPIFKDVNKDSIKNNIQITVTDYMNAIDKSMSFRLSIKTKAISEEKAKILFEKIILAERDFIEDKLYSHSNYLFVDYYNQNDEYDYQIKALKAQIDLLVKGYNRLIKTYGDVKIDNINLSQYLRDVYYYENIDALQINVDKNGLVKNYDLYKVELENQSQKYQKEIDNNNLIIAELRKSISDYTDAQEAQIVSEIEKKISHLLLVNAELKGKIDIINLKLANKGTDSQKEEIENGIVKEYNYLMNLTDKFNDACFELEMNDEVFYYSNLNFKTTGEVSILTGTILFTMLGVILVTFGNFIRIIYLKKKKNFS